MGRRRDANRAEAIVRLAGAMALLIILFITIQVLPGILKGKRSDEMMPIMFKIIVGFIGLAAVISVLGLVVWWKVRNRKQPPPRH